MGTRSPWKSGRRESLKNTRAHGVPEDYKGARNPWKSRRAESLRRFSTRATEVPGEYVGILNPKRVNVESKRVNGDSKRVKHSKPTETKRNEAKRPPAVRKFGAYSATNRIGPARHDPGAATRRTQESRGKQGSATAIQLIFGAYKATTTRRSETKTTEIRSRR